MCHGSMTSYFLVATMQDQVKGSLAADPHHAPTPPLPLKSYSHLPLPPPPHLATQPVSTPAQQAKLK